MTAQTAEEAAERRHSPDDFLTTEEVAQFRRCSIRKLEDERSRGRGPAYLRDGGRILYRKRDVDAWVEVNLRGNAITEPQPRRRGRPRKRPEPTAAAATA